MRSSNKKINLPLVDVKILTDITKENKHPTIYLERKDKNTILDQYYCVQYVGQDELNPALAAIYAIFEKWDDYSNRLEQTINGVKQDSFRNTFRYANIFGIINNIGAVHSQLTCDPVFCSGFEKMIHAIQMLIDFRYISTLQFRNIYYLLNTCIATKFNNIDYDNPIIISDGRDQYFLNRLMNTLSYAENWLYLIPLYRVLHFEDIPNLDDPNLIEIISKPNIEN